MSLACLLSLGLFLYNFKKFKEKALRSKKKKEKKKDISCKLLQRYRFSNNKKQK